MVSDKDAILRGKRRSVEQHRVGPIREEPRFTSAHIARYDRNAVPKKYFRQEHVESQAKGDSVGRWK